MTLNDRQRAILKKLDELTTPAKPGAPSYHGWGASYGTEGLAVIAVKLDVKNPRAAGQTLRALKRRGLAESDGGGCYLAHRWRITARGREEARAL